MPIIATIEDDDIDAMLIAEDLCHLGRVVRFKTLWEGMAAMVEDPPDAVVLDLHMSDSPNADCVGLVCGLLPGVPVIVCSDDASEDSAAKSLAGGAVAHLHKAAIGSGRLPMTIDQFLHQHHAVAA